MQKLFVSYARANKDHVDQLVEHLALMGYETWVDVSLRGGQDWWEEILDRITESDVFITVVSEESLKSTACGREFDWAEILGKPVLPVLIDALPATALPRRISRRQIIDYSDAAQRDRAALRLQGGLGTLHRAPALPQPLPQPPDAPLSYLTDLVDMVGKPTAISHQDQHQIVIQLEQALNAIDPEERRGAGDILDRLSKRPDLYADVYRTITRLKSLADHSVPPAPQEQTSTPPHAEMISGPAVDGPPANWAPPPAVASGQPPPGSYFPPPSQGIPQHVAGSYQFPPGQSPYPVPSGTAAPVSAGRRLTATLIDVIPVLVMFGVAYGIAVANPARRCYMYLSPSDVYYEHCYIERSLAGSTAIVIAAVTALAYMAWNWIYRQSRKGATIGESALKIKMLDEAGRPPGFSTKRIVGLAIPVVAAAVALLLGVIQLTSWTINSDTNLPSTGWTGTDSS